MTCKEEVKKKGKKKGLKIFGIVMAVLILAIGVCVSITYIGVASNQKFAENIQTVQFAEAEQPNPTFNEELGYWEFNNIDREFRVMQLTDVHIGGGFMSIQKDNWALNAVATLVERTKPDLVIVTGDICFPVPFMAGTFNNLPSLKMFATMMENLGVYWTFAFGNHDTEIYSFYNREDISEYFEEKIESGEYKYCLYTNSFSGTVNKLVCDGVEKNYEGLEAEAGFGNTIINIRNSKKEITQSLVILDSHSYEKGFYRDYDHIHECQIDWYTNEINKLNKINKSMLGVTEDVMTVKSLAFFHIPLEEYKDSFKEWVDNDKKDTANVKYEYGVMGEPLDGPWVCCGVTSDNMFETMLALGSTQGVFAGHDHLNNYSLWYNGGSGDKYIRLTYGMSIDYLAYSGIAKKTAQRGCTIITINSDTTFDCYGLRLDNGEKLK